MISKFVEHTKDCLDIWPKDKLTEESDKFSEHEK